MHHEVRGDQTLQTIEIIVFEIGFLTFIVCLAVAILTALERIDEKRLGRRTPPSKFQRRFEPFFDKINRIGAGVVAPLGLLFWVGWAATHGDLIPLLEFFAVVAAFIGGVRLLAYAIPRTLKWCWNHLDLRLQKALERILFFAMMFALGLGLIPLIFFCGVPLLPFLLIGSAREFVRCHGSVSGWRRLRVLHEPLPPGDTLGIKPEELAKATSALEALGFESLGDFAFQIRMDDATEIAVDLPPTNAQRRKRPPHGSATGFERLFHHPGLGCLVRLIKVQFSPDNGTFATGGVDFRFESYAGIGESNWFYATDGGTDLRCQDPENRIFPHPRRLWTELVLIDDLAIEKGLRIHLDRRADIARAAGITWDSAPALETLWASEERSAEYVREIYRGLTPLTALCAAYRAGRKRRFDWHGVRRKGYQRFPPIRCLNDIPRREWLGALKGRISAELNIEPFDVGPPPYG